MIKINLLNNQGLQTEDSSLDLPKIEKSIEQSPVIKSKLSEKNEKKFNEIKKDLDKKSRPKKKPLKIGSILFVILIILIGASIVYLFNFTDIPEKITSKISTIKTVVEEKRTDTISTTNNDEKLQTFFVSHSIADQISNKSNDLSLIAGVLELLPENVQLIDFNIKNDNLSIICIVKDIISGENIKFFIYNHKNSFKPELFYIEKTEDAKNYQITSLTKILKNNLENTDYNYFSDKQISGFISKTGRNLSLDVEPLTISKRDQTIIRKGFIYVNGSRSNIISFCRELSSNKINISYDNLEINSQQLDSENTKLELKIGITIFPQK